MLSLNAAFVASAAVAFVWMLGLAGINESFDFFLWEERFKLKERSVTGEIVYVDIDAKSLHELGVWPLPRRLYANMTDKLVGDGASEIVFDIDFSSASNLEDDTLLAEGFLRAGNVSLASFLQSATTGGTGGSVVNKPIDKLLETAWPVVVMIPVEDDSRIWRSVYGMELEGIAELSLAAFLGEHTGGVNGDFWIDYSIAVDTMKTVSLVDVLNSNFEKGTFQDRKVVIGASAQELRDIFPVPAFEFLPGAVIQALAAETLLQERAIKPSGEIFVLLVTYILFVLLLLAKSDGWALKLTILAVAAIAIEVTAFLLLRTTPILVPTASSQLLLATAACVLVLREIGFQKLLSHLAKINQRNSERVLGLVFNDSFDAIIVLKNDGTISAASQMAKKLFQSDICAGQEAKEVLPTDLVAEAYSVLSLPPENQPEPKILSTFKDDGSQRIIEYVVTRSEHTQASQKSHEVSQAMAILTCRDVTEERQSAERLAFLARYDSSCNLLNRNGFEECLEVSVQEALQRETEICVLQFAVANLDQIVASLGFSYGDQVRKKIADRLKEEFARQATWSAISADVFAGVFECRAEEELAMVERLSHVIGEDYKIEGARISVQLNFGFIVSDGTISPENLLKKSGNALSKSRRGQTRAVAFRPEMDEALARRRTLETELFKAISRDELYMVYQPLVNLTDQSIYGVEALMRWNHRELGFISPGEFIPIAEENGYVVELGAWAMRRAMEEAQTWSQPLRLSINVSALQFARGNLVSTVAETLRATEFPAERTDLEITETLFIDDGLDLDFQMQEIKELGCSFSLDDFGTGYSSLGYLPKYPFSKIKLDQSFVSETVASQQDVSIIEAVLHLAKGHNMVVLVEGIETQMQASRLNELGCPLGQGYLFGRPMNSEELNIQLQKAA